MLTRPCEQEAPTTLDLLVKHFSVKRVRNKSDKSSGASYLSEISRGPVV